MVNQAITGQPHRVAFITGASSGIGRAAVIAFARAGYHVAGTARRADRLQSLQDEINALPMPHGDFLPVTGDVTDADSLSAAIDQTLATFGRLDVLVANAGLGLRGSTVDVDWGDIETLLRTNIDGVLHSIRYAVPAMRKTGGGHIFTISSVTASTVMPYAAVYGASKAFVSSLAHSLRLELDQDNIRVTDFLVGRTHTEFNEKRLGEGKRTGGGTPTLSPDRVAQALVDSAFTDRKTVTLGWFNKLLVLANKFFPHVIGRFTRKQYK